MRASPRFLLPQPHPTLLDCALFFFPLKTGLLAPHPADYKSTLVRLPPVSSLRSALIAKLSSALGVPPLHPALQSAARIRTAAEHPFVIASPSPTLPRLLHTLCGHSNFVSGLALSAATERLVSGSGDATAQVWNTRTGAIECTFMSHSDCIKCIALCPDGVRAVSGDEDATVRIWHIETGREQHTLTGHSSDVCCVAVSPDNRTAASGSVDQTIRLWSLDTGRLEATLAAHSNAVTSLAYSADGSMLASSSTDAQIKVWRVRGDNDDVRLERTLGPRRSEPAAASSIAMGADADDDNDSDDQLTVFSNRFLSRSSLVGLSGVAFTPDGQRLVSAAAADSTITVWRWRSGQVDMELAGHTDIVNCLALFPDGHRLASGSHDTTVRIWNLRNGALEHILTGHTDCVTCVAVAQDGRTLVSGADDRTIKIWGVASG